MFGHQAHPLLKTDRSGHLSKYSEASIHIPLLVARLSAWQSRIWGYPWPVSSLLALITSDRFSPTLLPPVLWINCLYVVVNHSQHHVFLWLCWKENSLFSPSAWLAPTSEPQQVLPADFQHSEHTPRRTASILRLRKKQTNIENNSDRRGLLNWKNINAVNQFPLCTLKTQNNAESTWKAHLWSQEAITNRWFFCFWVFLLLFFCFFLCQLWKTEKK